MFRKLTIEKCFSCIIILLSVAGIWLAFGIIVASRHMPIILFNLGTPYLQYTRYLMLFMLLVLLFLIKRIRRLTSLQVINKDDVILAQQKSMAKQTKLLDNLMDLCSNTMEHSNNRMDFFSNISHELRTPLTIMLGSIQLMEQKDALVRVDRRGTINYNKTIRQNCYRLLRLINNFLDIAKLEVGHLKNNFSNCNVVYLIEEIAQSVIPYAEQKEITLEFDTEVEEIITSVDIDKIERIVLNLLSNAIKFTPAGGEIMVKTQKNNSNFVISVKDSGIGVPEEMQKKIFERFKQADNSLIKEHEGSGIGLSLVKSFVEMHGGSIRVMSSVNEGSEFIVEIPIRLSKSYSDQQAVEYNSDNAHRKIIEAINIELSHIYSTAS